MGRRGMVLARFGGALSAARGVYVALVVDKSAFGGELDDLVPNRVGFVTT